MSVRTRANALVLMWIHRTKSCLEVVIAEKLATVTCLEENILTKLTQFFKDYGDLEMLLGVTETSIKVPSLWSFAHGYMPVNCLQVLAKGFVC